MQHPPESLGQEAEEAVKASTKVVTLKNGGWMG